LIYVKHKQLITIVFARDIYGIEIRPGFDCVGISYRDDSNSL